MSCSSVAGEKEGAGSQPQGVLLQNGHPGAKESMTVRSCVAVLCAATVLWPIPAVLSSWMRGTYILI